MREPPRATSEAMSPEAASAHTASDAPPADDAARNTSSGDAAARMAQVIDQFIRQDCAGGESDIVAKLAPRPRDNPDRLPRIVTTSFPHRPPSLPGDDARTLRSRQRSLPAEAAAPLPSEAGGWSTTRRVVVAAVATVCVFSTGVLWATHRSESGGGVGGQAGAVAIAAPALTTNAAALDHPIRNTPVLIREGESPTFAPDFAGGGWRQAAPMTRESTAPGAASVLISPRVINGSEPGRVEPATPIAPIAPLVRVVPVEPVAVAPGPSTAGAMATPADPPPLDRDGLAERASDPAERHEVAKHTSGRDEPALHKRPAGVASPGQVAREPVQSLGTVPKAARGYVPADGWEMRRQGLRSAPEPEPSTLKKLVGLVWPFGKSATTAQPTKPVVPSVTAPAYSWTDTSHADP